AFDPKNTSPRPQHHRSNITAPSTSTIRSVGCTEHSPAPRDLEDPDRNQDHRPEALYAEKPKTHGVHEEKHAQTDQHYGRGWYSGGIYFFAPAECPSQSEWIRRWLSHLHRFGGAD